MKPYNIRKAAVVLELKSVKQFSEMTAGCEEALAQIKDRDYIGELLREGYQKVVSYGICFCKKSCMVKKNVGHE